VGKGPRIMKGIFPLFRLCSLLLLLSACGAQPPPISPNGTLAVSALLGSNEEPKSVDGVFGLLLFPRTLKNNSATLENVCRAFFEQFPPIRGPLQSSRYIIKPTFWPDTRSSTMLPRSTTCTDLIDNYDYDRAQARLAALRMADVRGPVLVAYTREKNLSAPLDLSGVIDRSDINFALRKWQAIIVQDVDNWSSQWANRMAVETRILLTNSAPVLMKVLSITPSEAASKPVAPDQIYRGTIGHTRSNEIHFTPL